MIYKLVKQEFEHDAVEVEIPDGVIAVQIFYTYRPVDSPVLGMAGHPIIVVQYLEPIKEK